MQSTKVSGNSFFSSADLNSIGLSPFHRNKLLAAGFKTVADLQGIGPIELAKEISISKEEALQILKLAKTCGQNLQGITDNKFGTSAFELLEKDKNKGMIVSCNKQLDNMLGGGVPLGKMTEFCGVPGIGKTQIGKSIQLAVDVNIPTSLGGVESQCIYIDTEGSFVVERVAEIANATIEFLSDKAAKDFTLEHILESIHYYRIHDYVEQIALINILPNILQQNPNIKLIVIDSITFHFRHDFDDFKLRSRLLSSMAQSLSSMATQFEAAVVVMNQMTTKFGQGQESELIPALGEGWGHCCSNRIILSWKDGTRYATLQKSSSKKQDSVPYKVTQDGIR